MSSTMQNVTIGKKPNPVTLTDGPPPRSPSCWPRRTPRTWPCGWPSGPAAARASATRCSSTPTWPTTTWSASSATVKVVVDPTSADLLKGSTLDYSDGLQGAGFHITNPNATPHLRLRLLVQLSPPDRP